VGIVLSQHDADRFRRQTIEMENVDVLTIRGTWFGPDGPDMAFMRLPPDVVSQLRATNSFFNLEKRRNEVLAKKTPTAPAYTDAIVGMIHEYTKDVPSEGINTRRKEFGALFSGGEVKAARTANGYDL